MTEARSFYEAHVRWLHELLDDPDPASPYAWRLGLSPGQIATLRLPD